MYDVKEYPPSLWLIWDITNPHNADLHGEAEKRDVETLVGEGQTWAI